MFDSIKCGEYSYLLEAISKQFFEFAKEAVKLTD